MKGMNLPDPLHPAIVQFPIVLIFLGTLMIKQQSTLSLHLRMA